MAVLRFPTTQRGRSFAEDPEKDRRTGDESEIRNELAALGIEYERWTLDRVSADASADEVLAAYVDEIDEMKRRGGYVTADVIDVNPETPNLEAMLARFDKEHTHSEDEVRFILAGRGIFFLALGERVASVEVDPGDMLRVPRGTSALVYALRGSPYPRHPMVSGHDGLDAALHRLRSRSGIPARLLWTRVSGAARNHRFEHMSASSPRLFLLDVEGTIAPISLVYGAAFPLCPRAFSEISAGACRRDRRCE